jgi:hypothetical protein
LQEGGAKKKLTKRNAVVSNLILQREFATANSHSGKYMLAQNITPRFSPLARGEEGYAPSTAPPFEKGGRKPFIILSVLTPLLASFIHY